MQLPPGLCGPLALKGTSQQVRVQSPRGHHTVREPKLTQRDRGQRVPTCGRRLTVAATHGREQADSDVPIPADTPERSGCSPSRQSRAPSAHCSRGQPSGTAGWAFVGHSGEPRLLGPVQTSGPRHCLQDKTVRVFTASFGVGCHTAEHWIPSL